MHVGRILAVKTGVNRGVSTLDPSQPRTSSPRLVGSLCEDLTNCTDNVNFCQANFKSGSKNSLMIKIFTIKRLKGQKDKKALFEQ